MGAAKNLRNFDNNLNKDVIRNFHVIQGEDLNSSLSFEINPAEDYFVFKAIRPMRDFFSYFPVHLSHWMKTGELLHDQLELQKAKDRHDYRYHNFF